MTLQRKNKAYGYFAGGRFGSKDGTEITDEIALNPSHFKSRTDEQSLSTLAHEMAHLWQHHFGKPSRAGYHNKECGGEDARDRPASSPPPAGPAARKQASRAAITSSWAAPTPAPLPTWRPRKARTVNRL